MLSVKENDQNGDSDLKGAILTFFRLLLICAESNVASEFLAKKKAREQLEIRSRAILSYPSHAAILLVLVIWAAGSTTPVFGDEAAPWAKDLRTVGYPTRLTENFSKTFEP